MLHRASPHTLASPAGDISSPGSMTLRILRQLSSRGSLPGGPYRSARQVAGVRSKSLVNKT